MHEPPELEPGPEEPSCRTCCRRRRRSHRGCTSRLRCCTSRRSRSWRSRRVARAAGAGAGARGAAAAVAPADVVKRRYRIHGGRNHGDVHRLLPALPSQAPARGSARPISAREDVSRALLHLDRRFPGSGSTEYMDGVPRGGRCFPSSGSKTRRYAQDDLRGASAAAWPRRQRRSAAKPNPRWCHSN